MFEKYLFYFITVVFFSCTSPASDERNDTSQTPKIEVNANVQIDVKTYKDSSGWGFDLYINGNKSIHQPIVPAIPGNLGFVSENDAKKTGDLMAYKIKHGIMPPAVSVYELDSLGIKCKR